MRNIQWSIIFGILCLINQKCADSTFVNHNHVRIYFHIAGHKIMSVFKWSDFHEPFYVTTCFLQQTWQDYIEKKLRHFAIIMPTCGQKIIWIFWLWYIVITIFYYCSLYVEKTDTCFIWIILLIKDPLAVMWTPHGSLIGNRVSEQFNYHH